jgi:hypothetical protein
MPRPYTPSVPETVGDMMDLLGMMMLKSPTFEDDYFTERNVETVFSALNQGLENLHKKLGDERYQALRALSDRMRAHFEADPEDKTEDSLAGRELILEMEDILKSTYKKKGSS